MSAGQQPAEVPPIVYCDELTGWQQIAEGEDLTGDPRADGVSPYHARFAVVYDYDGGVSVVRRRVPPPVVNTASATSVKPVKVEKPIEDHRQYQTVQNAILRVLSESRVPMTGRDILGAIRDRGVVGMRAVGQRQVLERLVERDVLTKTARGKSYLYAVTYGAAVTS